MTEVLSQDEIDQLLNAITSGDANLETVPTRTDNRKIKIYDFRRPDKFSKETLRTIQMMHETFARLTTTNLSAALRILANVHVVSTDQLTYEEFIRSTPPTTTLAIVSMDPLKGQIILELDPAVTFTIIDRLFGGSGEGFKLNRELTDIERQVIEGVIVKILGNLREAWAQVIDLRPRLSQIESNPQFALIVPPNETAVLVTLETKIGEVEGMISLCIPYMTIQPIVSKFSTQYWYSSVRHGTTTENLNVLKEKLSTIDVPVISEVGSIPITVREVMGLKVGDIIKLSNSKVTDPIVIKVGNKKKFLGRPGLVGKKLALQIVKRFDESEQETFEELIPEGEDTNV